MQRKPLATQKVVRPRRQRKKVVPFDKHAALPVAIVDGTFQPVVGSHVYAWRSRTGDKPQWHTCKVMRVSTELVELWDETLEQWFCFDPRSPSVTDVRVG